MTSRAPPDLQAPCGSAWCSIAEPAPSDRIRASAESGVRWRPSPRMGYVTRRPCAAACLRHDRGRRDIRSHHDRTHWTRRTANRPHACSSTSWHTARRPAASSPTRPASAAVRSPASPPGCSTRACSGPQPLMPRATGAPHRWRSPRPTTCSSPRCSATTTPSPPSPRSRARKLARFTAPLVTPTVAAAPVERDAPAPIDSLAIVLGRALALADRSGHPIADVTVLVDGAVVGRPAVVITDDRLGVEPIDLLGELRARTPGLDDVEAALPLPVSLRARGGGRGGRRARRAPRRARRALPLGRHERRPRRWSSSGRAARGAHGLAATFAHLPIVQGGVRCECGQRGCLATVASPELVLERAGLDRVRGRTRPARRHSTNSSSGSRPPTTVPAGRGSTQRSGSVGRCRSWCPPSTPLSWWSAATGRA